MKSFFSPFGKLRKFVWDWEAIVRKSFFYVTIINCILVKMPGVTAYLSPPSPRICPRAQIRLAYLTVNLYGNMGYFEDGVVL